jgi:hypothetical protein
LASRQWKRWSAGGAYSTSLSYEFEDANHCGLSRLPSRRQQFANRRLQRSPYYWRSGSLFGAILFDKIRPMNRNAAEILKDALTLPTETRAAIAASLRDSLDPHLKVRHRLFTRARRALQRLREGLHLKWVPAAREELHRR